MAPDTRSRVGTPPPALPTREFVRLLREHAAFCHLHERTVAHDRGLSTTQVRCLAEFADTSELTAKELTRRLALSHSRLSHVLDSLEGHQLITRRINPEDRRIIVVDLSPQGREVLDALEHGFGCRYEPALRAVPRDAAAAAITVLTRTLEVARSGPNPPPVGASAAPRRS